jgi:hypothetical protein
LQVRFFQPQDVVLKLCCSGLSFVVLLPWFEVGPHGQFPILVRDRVETEPNSPKTFCPTQFLSCPNLAFSNPQNAIHGEQAMGDNPCQPPKRNYLVEAMLRQTQAEEAKPEPVPDWWKYITQQPEPPSSMFAALWQPPYAYPFKDAKEQLKLAVWCLGVPIPGQDPAVMRYDCEGSIILFSHHGDCDSEYGWEIDHKQPVSKGGSDALWNLQPLNWRNNRRKGDNWTAPLKTPFRWP